MSAQIRFKVGLLGETARKLVVLQRDQVSIAALRAAISQKLQQGIVSISAEDCDGDEAKDKPDAPDAWLHLPDHASWLFPGSRRAL